MYLNTLLQPGQKHGRKGEVLDLEFTVEVFTRDT